MATVVDPKRIEGPWSRSWSKVVGSGRAYLALQVDYLRHLEMVKRAINCEYVRFHGILHDDVGIYREQEDTPLYNFLHLDRIYDSLLDIGVRPFVEFSFMPEHLASGEKTVFYWKGNICPPKDYQKWSALIEAFVRHCVARYGLSEVRRWYFEVWNEPNLKAFWNGMQEEYYNLYRHAAKGVKAVDRDIRVGGPASAGREWVKEFMDWCRSENVPLDFVTTHNYCCKKDIGPTGKQRLLVFPASHIVNGMIEDARMCHDAGLELHYTEWNSTWDPLDAIHDAAFNAAFAAEVIAGAAPYVESMSYWTLSDVFEEKRAPRNQFHGGFGLVAFNGIPKSTFHTFSFLSEMGGERLAVDHPNLLATRSAGGAVQVLAFNPCYEGQAPKDIAIALDLLCGNGDFTVTQKWVDEREGNAYAAWTAMGSPNSPSRAETRELLCAAAPARSISRVSVGHSAGGPRLAASGPGAGAAVGIAGLPISFSLPPNGVRLVTVRPTQ